ncbi:hypothetical protein GCM10023200_36300 [Actinomycetospora chlora]|uniref:Glycosyltransferase subfamily 4-like N-terminal domain-containing protein n=1 Tax=Actinomycetospora chlora TaxID=663608 RepID=A0ABP9BPS2_9PSEU
MGIETRPIERPTPWLVGLGVVTAAVATVPPALVGLDAPSVPVSELGLPPGVALALAGVGFVALAAWRLHADGARAAVLVGLAGAAVLLYEGVAIGAELGAAPLGHVYGAAGGAVAAAGLLGVLVAWRRRDLPPTGTPVRGRLLAAVAVVVLLAATRASVPAWAGVLAVVALVLVAVPLLVARVTAGVTAGRPVGAASTTSLRVLHLGLPDPGAAPAPAVELTRRLAAAGHRITVLTPGRPHLADRVEHHGTGWVHWTHPGPARPRALRRAAYVLGALVAVRRVEADVVVEEITAPLGSLAVAHRARRPTLAVVSRLPDPVPAGERAPLRRLRWWAIRTHRAVIARSPAAAAALAAAGSRADVTVVGTGIDPAALRTAPQERTDDIVVRVEHLGAGQRDLLVHAWAQAAPRVPGRLVLLGGEGLADELRPRFARLGLADRVEPAPADTVHARVAAARLTVVVPGIPDALARVAALEALAVGTPVLAGDTAGVRDVVPPALGALVTPAGDHDADAAALAGALVALHADRPRHAAAAARGPALARPHDRDVLAGHTEDVYLAAARAVRRGLVRR